MFPLLYTYCRQWRPSLSMVSPGLHLPPLKRKGSTNWVSRGIKKNTCPSPAISWTYWWWKNTCRNLCVLVLPNMRPQLLLVEANSTSCLSPWHGSNRQGTCDFLVQRLSCFTASGSAGWLYWQSLANGVVSHGKFWLHRLSENMWKPVGNNGFMWMCFRLFMWKLMKNGIFIPHKNSTIQQVN